MGCGTSKCSSLVMALDGPPTAPATAPAPAPAATPAPAPTPTTAIASPRRRYNGLTLGEQVFYLYELKQSSSSSALQAWWVETEVASVEHMARDGDAEVALVMKKGKELPQASIRFDKSKETPSSSSQLSRFVINLDKSWNHIAPVKALKLTQMQATNGKALTAEQEKVVLRYISSSSSSYSSNSINNSNNNGRESTVEGELATSTSTLLPPNKKHEKSRRKSMNHDILAAMQNNTINNIGIELDNPRTMRTSCSDFNHFINLLSSPYPNVKVKAYHKQGILYKNLS